MTGEPTAVADDAELPLDGAAAHTLSEVPEGASVSISFVPQGGLMLRQKVAPSLELRFVTCLARRCREHVSVVVIGACRTRTTFTIAGGG